MNFCQLEQFFFVSTDASIVESSRFSHAIDLKNKTLFFGLEDM